MRIPYLKPIQSANRSMCADRETGGAPGALNAFFLAVGMTVAVAVPAFSQSLSFSIDFDGRGTGASISISTPGFHSPSPASYQPSESHEGSGGSTYHSSDRDYGSSSSGSSYYHYEYQRYLEQQREAERRRELMERIREQERLHELQRLQGLLNQLEQLEGVDTDHRYQLKYRLVKEVIPQFESEKESAVNERNAVLDRLAYQMDHMRVPAPPRPPHYERLFIGGLFYAAEDAARDKGLGLNDPFTGRPFDATLGFGTHSYLDWARVIADHFLGDLNRLSERMLGEGSPAQLLKLKGATVDELVCHSNGCAVAQALIAKGFIKVGTLRVLGGDAAVMDLDSLHALHEKTGVAVSVYAVVGDPVPLLPTGWQILDLMKKIGTPLPSFQSRQSLTYEALGLKTRAGFRAGAAIEVQFLTAPVSDEPWTQRHIRDTYFGIITAQRMIGVRLADGRLNPAAINQ
jgi:hypothetical protein